MANGDDLHPVEGVDDGSILDGGPVVGGLAVGGLVAGEPIADAVGEGGSVYRCPVIADDGGLVVGDPDADASGSGDRMLPDAVFSVCASGKGSIEGLVHAVGQRNAPASRRSPTSLPVAGKGKASPFRSYATVNVSDMKSDVKLSFIPPVISNGKKHVVLCDSDCSANDFQFSLVGHFIAGCIQFAVVRSLAFRLWKTVGLTYVRTLDNGFFVFVFASVKARDDVLERGPWFFLGKPIFLRWWERMLSLSKENLAR
ncbi:hypothetical protein Dimus_029153, partial [Dionaea muscipula]